MELNGVYTIEETSGRRRRKEGYEGKIEVIRKLLHGLLCVKGSLSPYQGYWS